MFWQTLCVIRVVSPTGQANRMWTISMWKSYPAVCEAHALLAVSVGREPGRSVSRIGASGSISESSALVVGESSDDGVSLGGVFCRVCRCAHCVEILECAPHVWHSVVSCMLMKSILVSIGI